VESLLNSKPVEILVVEDETEIRELISLLLLRQGHRVQQCQTAAEAIKFVESHSYDLVVLDWMLPQMSGIEFLKSIQQIAKRKLPVLMVTAKADPQDIVSGLEAGADDYLTKPFDPNVLTARVKALIRRSQNMQASISNETLQVGALSINLATYEVKCESELLHLTPSEFKILVEMAQNQGRVLPREHLILVVQGEGVNVTGRTIDTHVFGLRKKLGQCADWIETIRGVGYRIRSDQ
jgi:DNA-binding response OmpR family regulator